MEVLKARREGRVDDIKGSLWMPNTQIPAVPKYFSLFTVSLVIFLFSLLLFETWKRTEKREKILAKIFVLQTTRTRERERERSISNPRRYEKRGWQIRNDAVVSWLFLCRAFDYFLVQFLEEFPSWLRYAPGNYRDSFARLICVFWSEMLTFCFVPR